MSDYGERLKALRKAKYPDFSEDMDMHDITDGMSWMADRIEELEAKLSESEALLAKAVGALEVLSDYKNLDTSDGYYDGGCSIFSYTARQRYGDFDDFAHTTLTELKGGKDEDEI